MYADRYITKEKKDEFSKKVISEIEQLVEKELQGQQLPEGELFQRALREGRKIALLEETLICWKRGLEELN